MSRTTKMTGKIKSLPPAREMMRNNARHERMLAPVVGTEAQAGRAAAITRTAHRMRESLKRGHSSIDLLDSDAVAARVDEYLRACQQDAALPIWTDMIVTFGLSRQYVHRWLSLHPDHETAELLSRVRDSFASALIGGAMEGTLSPVPTIFALKNVHGWTDHYALDQTISTGSTDDRLESMDDETFLRWMRAEIGEGDTSEATGGTGAAARIVDGEFID